MPKEIPSPRYDFFQTATQVTVSVYIKGYGASPLREAVKVSYGAASVTVELPALEGGEEQTFTLAPLAGHIVPGECSERVLGTKIELSLVKDEPVTWPSVLGRAGAPALTPAPASASTSASALPKPKPKKNWDKLALDLDEEDTEDGPNAGGGAALQKLFSGIYANADENTKRAMIKSFTESGGTTLSTDWSTVGQGTVPVRPPEGMEERKL